jgi:hypothetical protein
VSGLAGDGTTCVHQRIVIPTLTGIVGVYLLIVGISKL